MSELKLDFDDSLEFLDWIYWKPAEARERGVDLIPLRGAPREDPPKAVIDAAIQATRHNADIDERGTPEFLGAVARFLRTEGVVADPDREALATNGGMNATFIALASLLGAGDEVIFPTPQFYYWNSVKILNGVPVLVPCSERDDWAWDPDAIEAAVTPRTKAIVYTNPCNPTGFMPTEQHLRQLGAVAERHDLVLIEDQAYEKFNHTGRPYTSAGSIPELWDRCFISYSLHKNYTLHGWRAGFLAGGAKLIERAMPVATWINLRVNHVTQAIATAALESSLEWVDEVVRPYRDGRDLLLEGLAEDPGITMSVPVQGGTMGFIRVEGLGLPSRTVSERLLFDFGISTVPGFVFGPSRDSGEYVRIPFSVRADYPGSYKDVVDRLIHASAVLRSSAVASVR